MKRRDQKAGSPQSDSRVRQRCLMSINHFSGGRGDNQTLSWDNLLERCTDASIRGETTETPLMELRVSARIV